MLFTTPNYRIEADPLRRTLRCTLIGLWDLAVFSDYLRDLIDAESAYGAGNGIPPEITILVDLRRHAVQPRDVAQELQALIGRYASSDNPCAIVMSSSAIQKSQVGRIGGAIRNQAPFTSEDDAVAWLAEQARR